MRLNKEQSFLAVVVFATLIIIALAYLLIINPNAEKVYASPQEMLAKAKVGEKARFSARLNFGNDDAKYFYAYWNNSALANSGVEVRFLRSSGLEPFRDSVATYHVEVKSVGKFAISTDCIKVE